MFRRKFLLVSGLIMAVAASQSVWAQQYARPSSTDTPTPWTVVGAADHHSALNEVSTEPTIDDDYINSGDGVNSTIVMPLSGVSDPGPGNYVDTHFLRYRCQSTGGGGAKERCTAALYDDTRLIFDTGNINANGGAFTLHEFLIPDASESGTGNPPNYNNLRIELTSSNLAGGESIQISWFELEVPNASAAVPPTMVATPTVDAVGVVSGEATLGGELSADGGGTISDCGVDWRENGGSYGGAGSGSAALGVACSVGVPFSLDATGLTNGTTYFFRSWATNESGTSNSASEGSFVPYTTPSVTTGGFTGVTQNQATLAGTVTNDGGSAITDCGVEWRIDTGTYGDGDSGRTSFGVCTVSVEYTVDATGLNPGTTYFYRAFADTALAVETPGGELSFTTDPGLPTVATRLAAIITSTTADLGGDVTSNGGSAVTDRGVVFDTAGDPENGPNPPVSMGTGTGPFVGTVTYSPPELADSLVYFQAYATNTAGTAYSAIQSFQNVPGQPTNIVFGRITGKAIIFSWTPGAGDGSIVVMRPFGTIEIKPADGSDYLAQPHYPDAPLLSGSTDNFVVYQGSSSNVWVTGLDLDTQYSIAIYSYTGSGASTVYDPVGPAEAHPTTTLVPVHNYDNRAQCGFDCHNPHGGGFMPRSDELTVVCAACHSNGASAEAKQMFANHLTPTSNPGIDYVDCGFCHELHNPGTFNTTESLHSIDLVTRVNKSFLRANVDKYVPGAATPAYLHTDQSLRVTGNPNGDPPQAANNPDRAVEDGTDAIDPSTPAQARGYCQVCHTMTSNHTNNPTTSGSEQCHDGAGNTSCGPAEVHCGACHEHSGGFSGGSCTTCHDQTQGSIPRRVITAEFEIGVGDIVSSHIKNAPVTPEDCEVCHDQSTHQDAQTVRLWDVDDGVTSFPQATAGAPTTDTGEGEPFAGNCLSCHDDGFASSLDTDGGLGSPTPGQTQTSPFSESAQAPDITPTALAWTDASHNRTIAEFGATAPITCVGNGTNGCHGSGHGSNQEKLWAPANDPAITATDFCLNCHDGSLPPALDIAAEFAAANSQQYIGGDAYATVNGRHDVLAADQAWSGAEVTCKDCHSPHILNNSEQVHNPDTRASLDTYRTTNSYSYVSPIDGAVTLNYDSGTNNGGLGPDFNPTKPMDIPSWPDQPDHVEFCLTCHDGTTPPGVVMPGTMLNIADTYRTIDQHGNLIGTSSASRGYLKPPWVDISAYPPPAQPPRAYAALPCTYCHAPHGAGNIYNLRTEVTVAGQVMTVGGVNAFPGESGPTYTLPLNGTEQEQFGWGAWCTFCHEPSHDTKDGLGCQSGHTHGGGNF
jgi:hypothetical protein